jgi:guanosine-3',5'-bis(diphosphate) 3'-pyrophosphohydrolase
VLLYDQLREKLNYLEDDKIEPIYQAYLVALESHFGQKRESGEKYINHPIAVASILAEMHVDYQSIIAALLHDVIEDTPITKEGIVAEFGQTVADLVDGITKLDQIEASGTGKDEAQAQSFRKMVLAMSRDIRVILIKLADRLHNMRTINCVSSFKRRRVARETLDIYAPIANRLGMYKMCTELEDLAFAALYPRRYQILKRAVEQVYGKHKEVILALEKELNDVFAKSALDGVKIFGRIKNLYGIYKKMLDHRAAFANIMDVYAFRVVVQNVDDCYRSLGIIHGLYKPIPGKFKDYIAIPKFNGYQSLHTVLFGPHEAPVEVQIRTKLMDQMANNGIAAHWLYKTSDELVDMAHMRAQQWVKNLLEMQQSASSSLEFLENVKIDLFPDKVYVFTPKGVIMELPRGATAVDFAYAVHTDIGNSCVAVRINRKFLPLSTALLNGQTISIITSQEAKPNPAWLSFVITGKARSGIRHYLKSRKREELMALGKQLLDKVFGLGNRLAVLVAYQLMNSNSGGENKAKNKIIKDVKEVEVKPLLIRGAEGVAITFASCCHPIPGDPIVGYLNAGYGLDIHTQDCINLVKLRKQPEKCLPVSWAEDVSGNFRVALQVEVVNHLGSLAKLTEAIAKANANIEHISSSSQNSHSGGYILVLLQLLVKNLAHFERVRRYISNVPAVVGVSRINGS